MLCKAVLIQEKISQPISYSTIYKPEAHKFV